MIRKILLLFFVLVPFCGYSQSLKLDTIYYDTHWKQIDHKEFASYYRVAELNDTDSPKMYRTYKTTGELFSEGYYIVMDRDNDSNTIFHGENIQYYPSGKVMEKSVYLKGKRDGLYNLFFENGLTKISATYVDGLLDGLYTEFLEDGTCKQIEYIQGQPKNNAYILLKSNGCAAKYDINTNETIYEAPPRSAVQTVYVDGVTWKRYQQNGLTISATMEEIVDYGRYYKVYIVLANNSLDTITFDPTKIRCSNIYPNFVGSQHVYSADEYLTRVKNRQTFRAVMYGLAAGLSAANAGYSHSTSYVSGYGYGSVSSPYSTTRVNYSHYGSMRINTTTYNAAAAYQASVLASAQIAGFQYLQNKDFQSKKEEYLKLNTLYPGQVISGYVNIERNVPHYALDVSIDIGGVDYVFSWEDSTYEIAKLRDELLVQRDELLNDINIQYKYLKANPQEIPHYIEMFEGLVDTYYKIGKVLDEYRILDYKIRKLRKIAKKYPREVGA